MHSQIKFLVVLFILISSSNLWAGNKTEDHMQELATLGGGCFWCVEAVFEGLKGVDQVISGYAGGDIANPTYEAVCTGSTGHAEVVQVYFNPEVISYAEILDIFFKTHDPTTLNRQGADRGTQYRSVIFYHSDAQKESAKKVMQHIEQEGIYDDPLVTEIAPLEIFYQAETYHQNYFRNNPNQGYCQVVINPKIMKMRKAFKQYLK